MTVLVTVLFYGIFISVVSFTFSKVKTFFSEKKYSKMIFCIILIFIEIIIYTFIYHDLKIWKNEQLKSKVGEYSQDIKNNKAKTLNELAVNAPLPKIHAKGMKFIDLGELSIMFDTKFEVPQDSEYTLCNWIDSLEENEMKIISFTFNKADLPNRTNFSIFDEEEYKTFVKNIQQRLNMAGNATGDKISFIDDGYFKVNDNIIIWTSGIVNL